MIENHTPLPSFCLFEEKMLTCKSPKLFLIDIKQFKNIILTYGDEGESRVLSAFHDLLLTFATEHEMELFALFDDTFALLIDTPFELSKMEHLISALSREMEHILIPYEGKTLTLNVHIGISFDHFEGLQKAQKALLVAKAENQLFVTYSEFANVLMNENEEAIEAMIKTAIEEGQIVLHFQSIIDKNSTVLCYEALLRLAYHNTLQSPKLFLKIAKKRHFYDRLLESIAQKALTLAKQKGIKIALNLSWEDLQDQERLAFIETTFSNQPIILEIEYKKEIPFEPFKEALQQLKHANITLSLDNVCDSSLLEFCDGGLIDIVKVHGSLIRNLCTDEHARFTCNTILELCKAKNIQTVATHLNSQTTLETVRTLGFDLFQGYIIDQPHAFE